MLFFAFHERGASPNHSNKRYVIAGSKILNLTHRTMNRLSSDFECGRLHKYVTLHSPWHDDTCAGRLKWIKNKNLTEQKITVRGCCRYATKFVLSPFLSLSGQRSHWVWRGRQTSGRPGIWQPPFNGHIAQRLSPSRRSTFAVGKCSRLRGCTQPCSAAHAGAGFCEARLFAD